MEKPYLDCLVETFFEGMTIAKNHGMELQYIDRLVAYIRLDPTGELTTLVYSCLRDLKIIKPKVLNNKHVSAILKSKTGFSIKSISFNSINTKIGKYLMSYKKNINVVGQINENIWNNKKTLQLTIRDLIL